MRHISDDELYMAQRYLRTRRILAYRDKPPPDKPELEGYVWERAAYLLNHADCQLADRLMEADTLGFNESESKLWKVTCDLFMVQGPEYIDYTWDELRTLARVSKRDVSSFLNKITNLSGAFKRISGMRSDNPGERTRSRLILSDLDSLRFLPTEPRQYKSVVSIVPTPFDLGFCTSEDSVYAPEEIALVSFFHQEPYLQYSGHQDKGKHQGKMTRLFKAKLKEHNLSHLCYPTDEWEGPWKRSVQTLRLSPEHLGTLSDIKAEIRALRGPQRLSLQNMKDMADEMYRDVVDKRFIDMLMEEMQ